MAAISWCLQPAGLRAQTVSGTILGVVQDQQGGSIPKADVAARNLDTGVVRKTVADDIGNYRIASVPAGSYEISTSAAGFKTEVRSGVLVTVGGDVSVNFSLTVGAINEKVEVTGEAAQVDTSTSAMGGFVNSATIRELPLNGRDWLQLALLQPGVSFNTGQQTSDSNRGPRGNGIALAISGGRPTDNAFRIDGLVVNDYANGGPGSSLRVNMGVDAIREFSVLTNDYSAEYGRGSGGVVNAITKSGTNQVHGSAYEFVRNSAFDARNFFDPHTIAPFHRDQYGGAVGGPIKKDKTFFFANYEKLGELKSLSSSVTTLSANAHNGLLCANTACSSTNQVAINPKILPYLALYPLPNGAVTGNNGIFAYAQPRHGEENYVIGKIDQYFSAATTLSGSYSFDNTTVSTPDDYNLKLGDYPTRRQNGVLSLQHLFSPSLINVTRVGVSRTFAGGGIDGSPRNPALADPSLGSVPGRNMPTFIISGITGIFGGIGAGLGTNGFQSFGYTAPQANDDLSWTKGRHNIRTGFSFERIDYNENSATSPNGGWTFTSIQNFLSGTSSQFSGDFPGTDGIRAGRNSVVGGYIQDDFRMFPNFTINLGIRYEMATVVSEANGKLANVRNLRDSAVTIGNPYYNNPTKKNFAPRIGFAWDPFKNGKTAVRGGFGMFDMVPLSYLFQARLPRNPPFYISGVLVNPPVSSFPNQVFSLLSPATAAGAHVEFNPARSYRAQWNLNIQRQLTRTMALTVGYVGSSGVHLARAFQDEDQVPFSPAVTFNSALDAFVFPIPAAGTKPQKINPNFGSLKGTQWDGHSSYDALQVNLVQRPIKNLTYQLAYTWSKSMDNGSSTFTGGSESANSIAQAWAFNPGGDRSVSDFDVPHQFVANFQYDLPVPAAVKAHAVANAILGGWQVGGIYTRQSGAPFSLRLGSDRAGTGSSQEGGVNAGQRPMYVAAPGCSPNAVTGNISRYIMTQCIAFPAQGVLGNLGRNTLRMPVFRDLDFSVFKNQNLWGERLKAQFRVEMFNILNNTNLQAQTMTSFDGSGNLIPSLGTPTSPTGNSSRQIQFGLRLLF